MTKKRPTKSRIFFPLACAVLALAAGAFTPGPLRTAIRDSFLARVTSPHYRILFSSKTLSTEAAQSFADSREPMFAALNRKLGGAAENVRITVIFDPNAGITDPLGAQRNYTVNGTTIRTSSNAGEAAHPELDPAADAEALLDGAWGQPGSSEMGYWTALWLLGQRRGEELGMAAAEIEQRVGYKKVAAVLSQPSNGNLTPQDRALLAAAWLNEVSAFGGGAQVQRLYATRKLDVAAATAALGTTTSELERKWQLWLFSYVAGMPSAGGASHTMTMPMNMPMSAASQ